MFGYRVMVMLNPVLINSTQVNYLGSCPDHACPFKLKLMTQWKVALRGTAYVIN